MTLRKHQNGAAVSVFGTLATRVYDNGDFFWRRSKRASFFATIHVSPSRLNLTSCWKTAARSCRCRCGSPACEVAHASETSAQRCAFLLKNEQHEIHRIVPEAADRFVECGRVCVHTCPEPRESTSTHVRLRVN